MTRRLACLPLGFAAASLLVVSAGCHLYFPEDDHPEDAGTPDAACVPGAAPQLYRDPSTGTCTSFGDGCGAVPSGEGEADPATGVSAELVAEGDWGWASCYTHCESLDEASCLWADGCRAIYAGAGELEFAGCWATPPQGPVRGGGCAGLDAQACSLHDDCSAVHLGRATAIGTFASCIAEEVPCEADLLPGYSLRNPASGACETTTWTGSCDEGPSPLPPAQDWGVCDGACEALGEGDCLAADACRGIYVALCDGPGSCPTFSACWPSAPSGPVRGGTCAGLDAYSCSRHDDCVALHEPLACPDGSLCSTPADPGAFRSCHSEPGPPPVDCPSIASESPCIAAACQPIYQGSGCTCTGESCTCATWSFVSCEAPAAL